MLEELQRTAEIEEERRAAEAAKREQAKVTAHCAEPAAHLGGQTDRRLPLRGQPSL